MLPISSPKCHAPHCGTCVLHECRKFIPATSRGGVLQGLETAEGRITQGKMRCWGATGKIAVTMSIVLLP